MKFILGTFLILFTISSVLIVTVKDNNAYNNKSSSSSLSSKALDSILNIYINLYVFLGGNNTNNNNNNNEVLHKELIVPILVQNLTYTSKQTTIVSIESIPIETTTIATTSVLNNKTTTSIISTLLTSKINMTSTNSINNTTLSPLLETLDSFNTTTIIYIPNVTNSTLFNDSLETSTIKLTTNTTDSIANLTEAINTTTTTTTTATTTTIILSTKKITAYQNKIENPTISTKTSDASLLKSISYVYVFLLGVFGCFLMF
jgi:hypothetical protein